MLRSIAALVLGAILLPAAVALAGDGESRDLGMFGQADSLYLGQVNAPQVDPMIPDQIRDHDNGTER